MAFNIVFNQVLVNSSWVGWSVLRVKAGLDDEPLITAKT